MKTTDDVVTNNRSEEDDLQEGDRRATEAVDALNWLTTTIYVGVRHPSPKRRRIAGPSIESRRESSDDSAEGEDNNQLLVFLRRRRGGGRGGGGED